MKRQIVIDNVTQRTHENSWIKLHPLQEYKYKYKYKYSRTCPLNSWVTSHPWQAAPKVQELLGGIVLLLLLGRIMDRDHGQCHNGSWIMVTVVILTYPVGAGSPVVLCVLVVCSSSASQSTLK